MTKYNVNVHYDYYIPVVVEAEDEEEALIKAKEIADEAHIEKMEFCDYVDSCITDCE